MPIISSVRHSSGVLAGLTPPALPRPPVDWAFTTATSGRGRPSNSASMRCVIHQAPVHYFAEQMLCLIFVDIHSVLILRRFFYNSLHGRLGYHTMTVDDIIYIRGFWAMGRKRVLITGGAGFGVTYAALSR